MKFQSQRSKLLEAKAGNDMYADVAGLTRLDYGDRIKPARSAPVRNPDRISEADVLAAVWKYISHHPKVSWCTRINSGAANGDGRYVKFNYKRGMSDLIGQMRDGRILCCEVKAPTGELLDHQREFLNEVLRHNGVAFVARSIEDAEKALA